MISRMQGGTAVSNAFRRVDPAIPGVLYTPQEARVFLGGDQGVADMGLFLRSLSSLYAIADCERFVDEMMDRVTLGLPTSLPQDHCRFALGDVKRILTEVPVPKAYKTVLVHLDAVEKMLAAAEKVPASKGKLGVLGAARKKLADTRRSIATTPELL